MGRLKQCGWGWMVCLAAGVLACGAPARAFTGRQVQEALEKAKQYILDSQQPDGHWGSANTRNGQGETALALIALYDCGMSVNNEQWMRGASWLVEQDIPDMYARTLRVIALSIAARKADRYRTALARDVRDILRGVRPNGGWRYEVDWRPGQDGFVTDNSCSQYVCLALREAVYARIEVPLNVWERIEEYWRTKQCPDGGWNYGKQTEWGNTEEIEAGSGAGHGSMSAAGLASCYIVFDQLLSRQRGGRPICRQLEYPPITRGLAWFDKYFSAELNPKYQNPREHYYYYLYNIERIGATSGRKYFGKHDWYKEITPILLAGQDGGGSLARPFYDHCYATIFLAKANAQVVMNKLEYHDLDWDVHSRDVANLTREMVERFERPLNWQIVDLNHGVREILDAPVLFMTGSRAVQFDVEDVSKFRQYVLEGGTLLGQAACGNAAFTGSFRRLCEAAFPEYELRELEDDHPLFTAHSRLRGRRIFGMDNGVRTCVFLLPDDISFYWHRRMSATEKPSFDLGVNVVVYAMDRGSFRTKVSDAVLEDFASQRTFPAALVRHGGGWNANPIVLERLSDALGRKTGVGLEVRSPVELGTSELSGVRLLWLSGYNRLDLPDAQKSALAAYVAEGGTVFVGAAGGSAAFYDSAVAMLDALLPEAVKRSAGAEDALINGGFAPEGYDCREVDFRRVLRVEKGRDHSPQLRLYSVGGRVAVIVSPYDVSSGIVGQTPWACRGYDVGSARQLGVNIALQAMQGADSPPPPSP